LASRQGFGELKTEQLGGHSQEQQRHRQAPIDDDCGSITSYRFIKMAASDAEYYFRFRICWYHCFQRVKVYVQTKFRRHISIDG